MPISKFRVLPYKQGSASARALAQALGGRVLKLQGSTYKPKPEHYIINWGNTSPYDPKFLTAEGFFNLPCNIQNASNKKLFFEMMKANGKEDLIPPFWTSKEDIPDEAYPIVCRTVLAGHSGAGIVLADAPSDLVSCSLYVKYVKKEEEYRVHVGRKEGGTVVIGVQKKARRTECENPNWQIRNHANGFVYKRNDINPPEEVLSAAIQALEVSGLDFGAVDVIWNKKKGKAYVLEINTAPGLEGTTVEEYKQFFQAL